MGVHDVIRITIDFQPHPYYTLLWFQISTLPIYDFESSLNWSIKSLISEFWISELFSPVLSVDFNLL